MRALVIGGGFGGMAAALRARSRGYDVTLVDRCERLGGRAQVYERDGFRHDAGPTVVTAPHLFEELFALFGQQFSQRVELVPLQPWYRFEFRDGTRFDYGGTLQQTLEEIRRISPQDVEGYLRLYEHSRKLYQVGFDGLADKPFHSALYMLRQAPHLIGLRAWRSVWAMVCKYLKSDYLRQAFSIQPLLVGGNPFDTTSIYGLIHFLERSQGVDFPKGGTGALVNALGGLMEEAGIEVRLGASVTAMAVDKRRISRVHLSDGTSLTADVVISNTDPGHLYRDILPTRAVKTSARLKQKYARKSMGLFVLYFGTARTYPDVVHHTIWMGPRYRELLRDIFGDKILADDFSLYLHRPTATDSSFAPPGCDSFYALVPVPNLESDIDWDVEGPRLRDRVVTALDRTLLPGLQQSIRADFFMTPQDFEHRYLSPAGSGFSIAPTFTQSAWFRFHNKGEGPENLFLTGAGTHPGAGMPGVLCSAKVVASLLPDVAQGGRPEERYDDSLRNTA